MSAAQESLGWTCAEMPAWDRAREAAGDGRHHLRRELEVEAAFWSQHASGVSVSVAAAAAGASRSSGYRWVRAEFFRLRAQGRAVSAAAGRLRVDADRAVRWETERRRDLARQRRSARADRHAAVLDASRHAQALAQPRARTAALARHARYWELTGQGLSNTDACKIMSIHRKTGQNIRRRGDPSKNAQPAGAGRYLSLHDRLQIADLLLHELSLTAIAEQLGRSVSTISREVRRHQGSSGRYEPHQADADAAVQRRRPREPKLRADPRLRAVVQRKLNRYWSPEQIAGWLRAQHPDDPARTVCHESIYRALVVPGAQCLHSRYTTKLRTGRTLRRAHALTRSRKDGAVRNMTMIADRPAVVTERIQPGHWEGDLILGAGCASAMITLRERVTHYGIIINLPHDHTSLTVTTAIARAFASLPAHLTRTLTWDQGVELARHQDLAAATGLRIYFAERSSPWQRGANENFNGLARQFFPKNTDLSQHTLSRVADVTDLLNTRPRKTLDYQTPAQQFRAAARAA